MRVRIKKLLGMALTLRNIVFVVALVNFVWFFAQSSPVRDFGSKKLSFCVVCPWYDEWTLVSLPFLSLIAAFFTLFGRWKGDFMALVISGYQVEQGITWLSNPQGFAAALSHRAQVFRDSDWTNVWELMDLQYLFALTVLVMALVYLVLNGFNARNSRYRTFP